MHVFEDTIQDIDRSSSKSQKKNHLNVAPKISFYDQLYQIINAEIKKYEKGTPALVSWLTGQERSEALQELAKNGTPSISCLNDSFETNEPNYPNVDVDFFRKLYPKSMN